MKTRAPGFYVPQKHLKQTDSLQVCNAKKFLASNSESTGNGLYADLVTFPFLYTIYFGHKKNPNSMNLT